MMLLGSSSSFPRNSRQSSLFLGASLTGLTEADEPEFWDIVEDELSVVARPDDDPSNPSLDLVEAFLKDQWEAANEDEDSIEFTVDDDDTSIVSLSSVLTV